MKKEFDFIGYYKSLSMTDKSFLKILVVKHFDMQNRLFDIWINNKNLPKYAVSPIIYIIEKQEYKLPSCKNFLK